MTNKERKFLESLATRFSEIGRLLISINGPVDMGYPGKPSNSQPGCYGGWCGVAMDCDYHIKFCYYIVGADAIAQYFGFGDRCAYHRWAIANPKLWDNYYGQKMFISVKAFGMQPDEKITTQDIGRHHLRVADNINQYLEESK